MNDMDYGEVCALCPHARYLHVIGPEEDRDDPTCPSVPHESFCVDCDEADEDHEWKPRALDAARLSR